MSTAKRTEKRTAPHRPANRLPWLSLLLVLLAALLPYLNSLGNGFVLDDQVLTFANRHVQGASAPGYFFTADFWEEQNQGRSNRYQPLVMVSFVLDHRLGNLTPFSCHLTNLLLHLLICLLLLLVLRRILPKKMLALAAVLLFAIHPLHTGAVAAVGGRAELLSALFLLAAWLVHLVVWRPPGTGGGNGHKAWLILVGTGLFILALLSAGSAVILLPAVLLGDLLRLRKIPAPETAGEDDFFTPDQRSAKQVFRSVIRRFSLLPWAGYGVLLAVSAGYLALRHRVLGSFLGGAAVPFLDNPLAAEETPVRLMTAVKVLGQYLWLQFWPVHLSADYSFNQVKLVTSPAGSDFLAALAACLALLVGAVVLWRTEKGRVPAFGILFFFCAIAPVSNIAFPIGTIMAERLLYLPSLGFCLILASLLTLSARELSGSNPAHPSRRWMVTALVLLIASGYAYRTVTRNRDWRDQQTVLLSAATVSPDSARVHGELGIGYFERGEYTRAAQSLERAVSILPDYPIALYMLGRSRIEVGELESARAALIRVAELRPSHPEVLLALGAVSYRLENLEQATDYFRRTLAIDPENPWAMESLGIALSQQGQHEEAIEVFRSVLELQPGTVSVHYHLAAALGSTERLEEAETAYRAALVIDPEHQNSLLGLADLCRRTGRAAEAAELRARVLGESS